MSVAGSHAEQVSEHGRFGRHVLEMGVSMMVGMMVSAAIFLSVVGMTAAEAMRQHAVLFVVFQAVGMTVVMVAWMRYRGHAWRGCGEMAAAMVIPAVPLIGLRVAGVISGPICGAYCALTLVAMVLVMLYRRSDYGGKAMVAAH
jgi:flagellar biosynthetic protein FliP